MNCIEFSRSISATAVLTLGARVGECAGLNTLDQVFDQHPLGRGEPLAAWIDETDRQRLECEALKQGHQFAVVHSIVDEVARQVSDAETRACEVPQRKVIINLTLAVHFDGELARALMKSLASRRSGERVDQTIMLQEILSASDTAKAYQAALEGSMSGQVIDVREVA